MTSLFALTVQHLRQVLAYAATMFAIAPSGTYRPEAHYMRGPGPKWRAKHGRPQG